VDSALLAMAGEASTSRRRKQADVGVAAEGKRVEREGVTANQQTILGSGFQQESQNSARK